MAKIPPARHSLVAAIYAAYEERAASEPMRPYLGASIIGHACERYLWLAFRWAAKPKFDGRMLRLFDTGHQQEARMVADLRAIGCEVSEVDEHGHQHGFAACGGHYRGNMDAAAVGLPEAGKAWHAVEFKTHGAKSFRELQTKGVEQAKPMHAAQLQAYMHHLGLERGLYLAVNKDTDELHAERLHYDPDEGHRLEDRAARVIWAAEPPATLSEDSFTCKWCDMRTICHGTDVPLPTCRSCAHATPVDGGWQCEHHGKDIDETAQAAGCADHRYIPVLLRNLGTVVEVAGNEVTYESEGRRFTNGRPTSGYTSREIHEVTDKSLLGDRASEVGKWAQEMREEFDARLTSVEAMTDDLEPVYGK